MSSRGSVGGRRGGGGHTEINMCWILRKGLVGRERSRSGGGGSAWFQFTEH